MTMKRFIRLSVLLLSMVLLPFANAARGKLTSSTFNSMTVYYGIPKSGAARVDYYITVSTPQGVAYGHYHGTTFDGGMKGQKMPLVSWSGTGAAPVLTVKDFDTNVSKSNCPGIGSGWQCASETFTVTVESDNYGCPWVAGLYTLSTNSWYISSSALSYTGPTVRGTVCPTVPVDTYDVSWDANTLKHEKVLTITPTGGTVSTTLKTYLMESGTLCDKSKLDTRGAACRVIGTGVTLSILGCDNNVVSTVALAHALTDTELHYITVSVNTKNIGTGMVKSTCNFQYILEQL